MTTRAKRETKRVGSARPSQLIYTFGAGSIVDLPNFSVIVAGIDDWEQFDRHQMVISEPRLLEAVQANLSRSVKEMRTAPWMEETRSPFDEWAFVGVPVIPFPRWLRCTDLRCNRIAPIDSGMFKLESDHPFRPDLTQYYHQHSNKKTPSIPVRFVVACPNGHIDDFPWIEYAHRKAPGGVCDAPMLKLYDTGAGPRSTDMMVECLSCEASA
ncbi:MAG: hypothetical protein M3094_00680, partial [Actinomycetia bacterium]|nr:hypothetical protein [Actinomycetes bacterium]